MSIFTPKDTITLPVFGAKGGIVLGTSILSAAKAERLPRPLAKAASKLKRKHQDLIHALRDRTPAQSSPETREAQRREAAAWSALRHAVKAIALLKDEAPEESELARRIEAEIFVSGATFAKLRYRMAWLEADERLELLDKEKLAREIDSLCGSLFLDAVRKAHRASGVVLGITKPKAARRTRETPPVPEVLAAFRTALKEFVVLAEGHRLAGSTEVADRLLAPLVEWQSSRPTRKRPKHEVPPAPAPTPVTP